MYKIKAQLTSRHRKKEEKKTVLMFLTYSIRMDSWCWNDKLDIYKCKYRFIAKMNKIILSYFYNSLASSPIIVFIVLKAKNILLKKLKLNTWVHTLL